MKLICNDCGKRYDYDKDEFCPKCGSYNPPTKTVATQMEAELEGRFAPRRAVEAAERARHLAKHPAGDGEPSDYAPEPAHGTSTPLNGAPKPSPRSTLRDVGADLKNMGRDLSRDFSGRPGGSGPRRTPSRKTAPGTRPKYTPHEDASHRGAPRDRRQQDQGTVIAIVVFIIILINFLRILFRIL